MTGCVPLLSFTLGLQTKLENAKACFSKIEQRAEAILSHTPKISGQHSSSLLRVIVPPKAAGYNAADFIAAECRWTELKMAGFTAAEAEAAGCDDVPAGAAAAETAITEESIDIEQFPEFEAAITAAERAAAETSFVFKISAQRLNLQAPACQYSPEKDLPDWVIFKKLDDTFAVNFNEVLKSDERRDKLEKLLESKQNPERLSSLSNFDYLCVHCISEFLLRYPKAAADAETSNLQAAGSQRDEASLGASVKNSSSVDEPTIRKSVKRAPSFGDVEKFVKQEMQATEDIKANNKYLDLATPVAGPDAEERNLELLKALGEYLEKLNRRVSKLEKNIFAHYHNCHHDPRHAFGPKQAKTFAKLQSLLVNEGLRFANSHQNKRHDLAFHVLERLILNSEYFIAQNDLIKELVEELNVGIFKKRLSEEKFKDLCGAVASEQLHFVFDILEIRNPGWNGDESPANSNDDEFFANSIYFVPEAEDLPPQFKRRQKPSTPPAGGGDRPNSDPPSASTQPLIQSQWAVAACKETKKDKIRSSVRDDTYIWLDLQGDVLMEALSYEKRDLKGRAKALNRLSIFKRLCKQACAVFVFPYFVSPQFVFPLSIAPTNCLVTITSQACIQGSIHSCRATSVSGPPT
jgi:hypothetical protein